MDPLFSVIGTFDENGGQMSRAQVEVKRKKEGKCPECGQQLFQLRLLKKKPLNIPGKVQSGKCLSCRSRSNSVERTQFIFGKPNKAQSQSCIESEHAYHTIHHSNSLDLDLLREEDYLPVVPLSVRSKASSCSPKNGSSGQIATTVLVSKETSSLGDSRIETHHRNNTPVFERTLILFGTPKAKSQSSIESNINDAHHTIQHSYSLDLDLSLPEEEHSPPLSFPSNASCLPKENDACCLLSEEPVQSPVSSKREVIEMTLGAIASSNISHPTLQEALSTLLSLCVNDKESQTEAASLGAIGIIVPCMTQNLFAKDICGLVCGLLWTFAVEPQHRKDIVTEGGVTAILNAMRTHNSLSSSLLQRKGCGALTAITTDGEGRLAVRAESGIDVIVEVMRTNDTDSNVLEEACRVLSNLAVYSEGDDDEVLLVTSGEIQVIATSMKRYIHEQPLQEAGCRTLWNYAQVPCNLPILLTFSELIHECLFQAANNFPACSMIAEALLNVLLS